MGLRFYRILLFLFGVFLFIVAVLRAIQPQTVQETYLMIYGMRAGGNCCETYLLNPDKRTPNRAQVGVSAQSSDLSPISPSQAWRLAHVRTRRLEVYLLPLKDPTQEPIQLDQRLGRSWQYIQWSGQGDKLYYLDWAGGIAAALFEVTPENDWQPEQVSPPMFSHVRTMQEQGLPYTTYFPWVLIGLAINVLVIAVLLPKIKSKRPIHKAE